MHSVRAYKMIFAVLSLGHNYDSSSIRVRFELHSTG